MNETIHETNYKNPIPIVQSRTSGKNAFSLYLRDVNTKLCRMYIIKNKNELRQLTFDRVVLKLTTREATKFMTLLQCFASDPNFDTVDKITNFSREQYIKERCIVSDDNLECSKH